MNRKRPALKPGDVCKYSKRTRYRYGSKSCVIVVNEIVTGDGQDGRSVLLCTVTDRSRSYYPRGGGRKPVVRQEKVNRRNLWFTGYNTMDKERCGVRAYKPVNSAKNNDGQAHCLKCGEPTKQVPGALFGQMYCTCENPKCDWYGN